MKKFLFILSIILVLMSCSTLNIGNSYFDLYSGTENSIRLYYATLSIEALIIGILFISSILFLLLAFIDKNHRYNFFIFIFTLTSLFHILIWRLDSHFYYTSIIWTYTSLLFAINSLCNYKLRKIMVILPVVFTTIIVVSEFINKDLISKEIYYLLIAVHICYIGVYLVHRLLKIITLKHIIGRELLAVLLLFTLSVFLDIFFIENYIIPVNIFPVISILLVLIMFRYMALDSLSSTREVEEKQNFNKEIRDIFTKFVPLEILTSINNINFDNRPPGDYSLNIASILLFDIRDFTHISEGISPKESFSLINDFYDIIGKNVYNNNGFIESFGGDGIKALFKDSPGDAIKAAIQISRDVKEFSSIKIGLSIHFGKVVLGTIGSVNRIQATVVSNISRVVSAIDHFESKMGIEIVASYNALKLSKLEPEYTMYLGHVVLKGEREPIKLYQIFPNPNFEDLQFKKIFESAILLLEDKKYRYSLDLFNEALKFRSNYKLTELYIRRITEFINSTESFFLLNV